jgi:hypothetical protein
MPPVTKALRLLFKKGLKKSTKGVTKKAGPKRKPKPALKGKPGQKRVGDAFDKARPVKSTQGGEVAKTSGKKGAKGKKGSSKEGLAALVGGAAAAATLGALLSKKNKGKPSSGEVFGPPTPNPKLLGGKVAPALKGAKKKLQKAAEAKPKKAASKKVKKKDNSKALVNSVEGIRKALAKQEKLEAAAARARKQKARDDAAKARLDKRASDRRKKDLQHIREQDVETDRMLRSPDGKRKRLKPRSTNDLRNRLKKLEAKG